MIHIWSLDDGYGDGKWCTRECNLIPSHVTGWREPMRKELANGEKINPFSHIGVMVGEEKYLVGEGAILQDPMISWVGGENKHTDKNFPVLLKTMLALMAEEPDVTVEPLVMGLPVRADEDESRHRLLRELVIGQHEVEISLADGRQFTRKIFVRELIIKKQPFGSFCDVILDKSGEIKDKVIASQFNVIVDIGARTLNIYTLDALEPVSDLCDHTNHGMYTAYKWVGDFLEEKTGAIVPSGKLPYIIGKGEVKGYNIVPIRDKAYANLANEIVRVLEEKLVNSWAFVDRLIFTGGGSTLLKPWLENRFKGKPTMFLDRFATARGLKKYGLRQVKQSGKVLIMVGNNGKYSVGE